MHNEEEMVQHPIQVAIFSGGVRKLQLCPAAESLELKGEGQAFLPPSHTLERYPRWYPRSTLLSFAPGSKLTKLHEPTSFSSRLA